MKAWRILLVVSLFIAPASFAGNSNPFAHSSISLSGGYYGGAFQGGSVSLGVDFPVAGGADEDGGFIFSLGPRFSGYIANYRPSVGFFTVSFGGAFTAALNIRFGVSFPVGSGFMGPYFDIRPAFESYFAGDGIIGWGGTGAIGFQHFFSSHFGWKVEFEGGVSFPIFVIPVPWLSAQAGLVVAF